MVDYQVELEQLAFAGKYVSVKTDGRGRIVGKFIGVDEFDTDPDRLGFCIRTAPHEVDVVFLDEIVSVEEYDRESDYITA